MKQNLDNLKSEIRSELANRGLAVFHSFGHDDGGFRAIHWDTKNYPDFRGFLDVAQQLDIKLISFSHSTLDPELIESAIDDLENLGLEFDEQKTYERRLRELSVYEGFTSTVSLSFDHNDVCYMYEIEAEWYEELMTLLDELDIAEGLGAPDDEEDSYGGYYSKN